MVDGYGMVVDGYGMVVDGYGMVVDGYGMVVDGYGMVVHSTPPPNAGFTGFTSIRSTFRKLTPI